MDFNLVDNTILLTIAGSRAYGTSLPTSDIDLKGICVAPVKQYCLGLGRFDQADSPEHIRKFRSLLTPEEQEVASREPLEGAVYDIGKFISIALQANPNILEVLWCDDSLIRKESWAGWLLRENRDIFLSKKVMHTYSGYAFSQLKRIKTHRSYLLNPPKKQPAREDFDLPPQNSTISLDEQNAFLWVLAKILEDKVSESRLTKDTKEELLREADIYNALQAGLPESVLGLVQQATGATDEFMTNLWRERAYRGAMAQWKAYQAWQTSRNPKRKAMEEKCGFDLKHASHLIRLMFNGIEALRYRKISVTLPPEVREEFMKVRNGDVKFEDLLEKFEADQKELKLAEQESKLPWGPDIKKAENLLIKIRENYPGELPCPM